MDWNYVQSILNDLPRGYLRTGETFSWWQNSLTAGLVNYTYALDGLQEQYDFNNSSGPWLDTWAQLTANMRLTGESDGILQQRIKILMRQGRSTAAAIYNYVSVGLQYPCEVTENFVGPNYWEIALNQNVTKAVYQQVAQQLDQMRPAGVPFAMSVISGGLYLDSINYLDAPSVTGAYLTEPHTYVSTGIAATTNQSKPTLPTVYLSDPTLNS